MRVRQIVLLCLVLLWPAWAWAARYDVDYRVAFLPEDGVAAVTIATRPGDGRLVSLDLNMPSARYSAVEGDGEITRRGARVLWQVPEAGGELRFRYRIDKRRRNGGFDARLTPNWTIVRGDHLIPSATVRATAGASSRATLRFDLPEGWSVEAPWALAGEPGHYRVYNPERAFDRPTGWMIAGELGIRREILDGFEIAVAAPRGEPVRRNEILAMIHVAFPEMKAAFGEMPEKVVIVSAGDPMWRGGLSGPQSLYMHADRPLISENGTSTLVHELVHLITRIQGTHEHWIAEGTAEYYSLVLLRRSGLISESRFQRGLDWMANHGRNVRTLRGVRSHGPVTARAVTLFAALDTEIQQATEGERTLDDVMRLLMEVRQPTMEDLEAAVEQVMGAPAKTLDTPLLRL